MRLNPRGWHGYPCLRAEFYGCPVGKLVFKKKKYYLKKCLQENVLLVRKTCDKFKSRNSNKYFTEINKIDGVTNGKSLNVQYLSVRYISFVYFLYYLIILLFCLRSL